ncbi:MAG: phosphonate ABC transporter, permease protein PhnE [Cyanobacteria bacterium P01_H01_bin.121]
MKENYAKILRQQQKQWEKRLVRMMLLTGIILCCFILVGMFDSVRIIKGIPAIGRLLSEMFPPDFSRFPEWITPIIDTLAMSVAGTVIAATLSLPLSLLAARNTSPHHSLFLLTRSILNVTRAVPELILGMILVAAIGFGKLPGTLALGIHSVGMLGKFFAESIELSSPEPVEAARAVGATKPQVIVHGILPQVLPRMASITLYRWEYNFRASIVLGSVGAGGIGVEIISALRILKYQQVSALLIVVFIVVTFVDSLSSYLRKDFVK